MAMSSQAPGKHVLDAGRLIDEGPWSRYQKLLVVGIALAIVVDGLDNQLLPNAIPVLITEWGMPRAAFTSALAIGPFGMMIGGLLGGLAGDRFGRRPTLITCVVLFGVLTCVMALVGSIGALSVLRLLAGIGLGGAMPNAATLSSEYVPTRQRAFAVTATIVCIPLGGALAGEIAALVIPVSGWRALFVVGGGLAIVIGGLLWRLVPESPKFLARNPQRWPELTEILRRSGQNVPDGAAFVVPEESVASSTLSQRVGSLFSKGFARDTLALWASFFFGLMVNYVIILLLPALLTSASVGFTQPAASRALAVSNYGGIAGALLGAIVLQRIGSRIAMLGMCVAAIVCGVVLSGTTLDPANTFGFLLVLLLAGALINGVQTTMYALAAHVYPTSIRSTGVGTAVAVGRIGNVLAAYAGSLAIDRGGASSFFLLWSILMAVVFVTLACIRRHVPGTMRAAH